MKKNSTDKRKKSAKTIISKAIDGYSDFSKEQCKCLADLILKSLKENQYFLNQLPQEISGVKIGDKFIPIGRKNKAVYTVTGFKWDINNQGKTCNPMVTAKHLFMGQEMHTEHPITTILRGRI